jgi:heme-degrading monooxygenase HmoA
MYTYIWVFEVSMDRQAEFLQHYGPRGKWASLFRRADGYVGTVLCRDRERASRFVTIDTWRSADAHAAFRESFAQEYAELDRRCVTLTDDERLLGSFDQVDTES